MAVLPICRPETAGTTSQAASTTGWVRDRPDMEPTVWVASKLESPVEVTVSTKVRRDQSFTMDSAAAAAAWTVLLTVPFSVRPPVLLALPPLCLVGVLLKVRLVPERVTVWVRLAVATPPEDPLIPTWCEA